MIGTEGQSFKGYCGLAEETDYGAGGSPDVFLPIRSDGFGLDNNPLFDSNIRGRERFQAAGFRRTFVGLKRLPELRGAKTHSSATSSRASAVIRSRMSGSRSSGNCGASSSKSLMTRTIASSSYSGSPRRAVSARSGAVAR